MPGSGSAAASGGRGGAPLFALFSNETKGPESASPGPTRPVRVLHHQHEGCLYVDLVAFDVAVLDRDVLVLNPRAFDASKPLGSASYVLLDGIVEARLLGSAQLGHSRNTHTYICLITAQLARHVRPSDEWPEGAEAKHKGRGIPKDARPGRFAFRMPVGRPAP
jgi:hypothetical protein